MIRIRFFGPGELIQNYFRRARYTLPRDDPASEPKGWIRGNTRIGPILEVTTSFQHFKFGVEVRIQSVNEDNSQSWVRISYGTVRYVCEPESVVEVRSGEGFHVNSS